MVPVGRRRARARRRAGPDVSSRIARAGFGAGTRIATASRGGDQSGGDPGARSGTGRPGGSAARAERRARDRAAFVDARDRRRIGACSSANCPRENASSSAPIARSPSAPAMPARFAWWSTAKTWACWAATVRSWRVPSRREDSRPQLAERLRPERGAKPPSESGRGWGPARAERSRSPLAAGSWQNHRDHSRTTVIAMLLRPANSEPPTLGDSVQFVDFDFRRRGQHRSHYQTARDENTGEDRGRERAHIEDVADGEERGPDRRAAGDPPDERQRDVVAGGPPAGQPACGESASSPDPPAGPSCRTRSSTARSVCGPSHAVATQHTVVTAIVMSSAACVLTPAPLLASDQQHDRHDERADHRDDLAPGVDAPPEPAHQIEQAGARADLQDDVEGVLRACRGRRRGRTSRRTSRTVTSRPAST